MRAKEPRPPKLADVARLAGVSPGTVSIYVNGRVGEHTRIETEITRAYRRGHSHLGLRPENPVAQSGKRGAMTSIGVFTSRTDIPRRNMATSFTRFWRESKRGR